MATSIKLNNGKLFPVIGLGTWQANPGEVGKAIKDAVEIGYRHVDGAAIYGNEPEVGAAYKDLFDRGVVKREDLFITSKLWNTNHHPDRVIPALKKTLSDLGLEYLDLYLVHWPFSFKEGNEGFPKDSSGVIEVTEVDYVDTWKQMEECVRLGLTKSIGISNFNSEQIARLLENAKIKPVTNQIECHPYLNQKKLIKYCKEKDIVITSYSPLANPSQDSGYPSLIDDPKMQEIAKKYGKSVAQVSLRYLIQIGTVPIPKSVHRSRIEQNFQVFDFELSADDIAHIETFDRNYRVCPFTEAKHAKYYPFDIEF